MYRRYHYNIINERLYEPRTTIQEIALSNYNQVKQNGLTSETITGR